MKIRVGLRCDSCTNGVKLFVGNLGRQSACADKPDHTRSLKNPQHVTLVNSDEHVSWEERQLNIGFAILPRVDQEAEW